MFRDAWTALCEQTQQIIRSDKLKLGEFEKQIETLLMRIPRRPTPGKSEPLKKGSQVRRNSGPSRRAKLAQHFEPPGKFEKTTRTNSHIPRKQLETVGKREHPRPPTGAQTGLRGPAPILPETGG